jgi:hypothetical protein
LRSFDCFCAHRSSWRRQTRQFYASHLATALNSQAATEAKTIAKAVLHLEASGLTSSSSEHIAETSSQLKTSPSPNYGLSRLPSSAGLSRWRVNTTQSPLTNACHSRFPLASGLLSARLTAEQPSFRARRIRISPVRGHVHASPLEFRHSYPHHHCRNTRRTLLCAKLWEGRRTRKKGCLRTTTQTS